MKAIAYVILSFLLSAALYRFNVNEVPLWFCFLAGFAIVALVFAAAWWYKTGGKKGEIAY